MTAVSQSDSICAASEVVDRGPLGFMRQAARTTYREAVVVNKNGFPEREGLTCPIRIWFVVDTLREFRQFPV